MTEHSKKKAARPHADDLRAAAELVTTATTGVTEIIEEMHRAIASGPTLLGEPLAVPARFLTSLAYGHVRNVTRVVGAGVDRLLTELGPLLGESVPGPQREAVVAVLNGVVGDHLAERKSPLAIEMRARHRGHALELDREALRHALPLAGPKLLVLVHGSSMTDRQWTWHGHDHGAALERDLGLTPVYLQYNSGLHVSTNGKKLATLLDELVAAWPVHLEEIAILAHSMGGLVARSACHAAELENLAWRRKLRKLVFLATPHHGSPLERGGNWLQAMLGITKYSAPLARLANIRSAGVMDLRYGNLLDEHWQQGWDVPTVVPLPDAVDCYAIAGCTSAIVSLTGTKRPGDGLVPIDSALGRSSNPDLTLRFPEAHQSIAFGAHHLDLLNRPDVYATVRAYLEAR